jgi:uncharacterized membrane protein
MNIFLWILQVLLALHTVAGAIWKFLNSEQTVPSLNAIPHSVWLGIGVFELFCSVALILPAISRRWGPAAPMAALCIAAIMLLYCGLHLRSGEPNHGEMIYWLVVAAVCGFIAYGRCVLKPF